MDTAELPGSPRLAGIVTRAELQAAGFSDGRIRTLVSHGALTRLCSGVYARSDRCALVAGRLPSARGDRLLRLAAALAVVGSDAVASHQDAAFVHGLPLLDQPSPDFVSVSRPHGSAASNTARPGINLHIAALPSGQVAMLNGIPVTTAARTVVDLARTTSFRSGVVVADAALRRGLTSKPELAAVLALCDRWPGVQRARSVVSFADGRSESPFESISRVAFRDGGLPPPELQVWVGGEHGPIARVDFLWRTHRTVAEADGALKYSDPEQARRQLRRDAALRGAGFEVVHFSWGDLVASPEQVVAAIRTAFRRADLLRRAEVGRSA